MSQMPPEGHCPECHASGTQLCDSKDHRPHRGRGIFALGWRSALAALEESGVTRGLDCLGPPGLLDGERTASTASDGPVPPDATAKHIPVGD